MNYSLQLQQNALFKDINEADLKDILSSLYTKTFAKDELIYEQGNCIDELFVILNGQIEISNYDFNGNKKMVAILSENDIFAESVALANVRTTPFDITAITPLNVLVIPYTYFFETSSNQLQQNLIRILADKNTFLTHKIECISKTTIKERVFEVLRYYYHKCDSLEIELPYNKTQLSEYLCVDRSSLTREIKTMETAGYFKNDRNHYRLNPEYFR
ncbi:Crp/Fnr family transcriptional regulator [Culicoidibacter larvae]|nr:Crp/Fnr family transcriptional regulator [Culicoidibacter larvae]